MNENQSEKISNKIKEKFPHSIYKDEIVSGVAFLVVDPKEVLSIFDFIKNESQLRFDFFENMTGVDLESEISIY